MQRTTVIFDFGGVLIDWNPRHLYRKLFAGDDAAMEDFLATVCNSAWNIRQDGGRPVAEATSELTAAYPHHAELIAACGILTAEAMKWFRGHYLRSLDDAQDWRASPVLAPSFAGVAPAIVTAAECDVLHDEGAALTERLRAAGVAVEYRKYPGMIHAFFGMMPTIDDALNAQRAVWAAFKRAFAN
jgi:acetyl esterase/lipase